MTLGELAAAGLEPAELRRILRREVAGRARNLERQARRVEQDLIDLFADDPGRGPSQVRQAGRRRRQRRAAA